MTSDEEAIYHLTENEELGLFRSEQFFGKKKGTRRSNNYQATEV